MKIFSSNDGCTAHHWEVLNTSEDWRVRWDSPFFKVQQRATYKCAHDGCHAIKNGWETIKKCDIKKTDGEFEDESMERLNEVLKLFKEFKSE